MESSRHSAGSVQSQVPTWQVMTALLVPLTFRNTFVTSVVPYVMHNTFESVLNLPSQLNRIENKSKKKESFPIAANNLKAHSSLQSDRLFICRSNGAIKNVTSWLTQSVFSLPRYLSTSQPNACFALLTIGKHTSLSPSCEQAGSAWTNRDDCIAAVTTTILLHWLSDPRSSLNRYVSNPF